MPGEFQKPFPYYDIIKDRCREEDAKLETEEALKSQDCGEWQWLLASPMKSIR
jgi:hypothetical protein